MTSAPTPSLSRYPDPAFRILDPALASVRLFSSSLDTLASGMRWAEGPVWFGDGRFLLVSDIPNDRILRWDEPTGHWGVFRQPSAYANGLARDRQGRLLVCEHGERRVTRTETDGRISVLADRFEGRRLNSPNDITCASDGSIWFTDPPFGIHSDWEGHQAPAELPQAVYRIDPHSGALTRVIDDLAGPNGLAFAPDESRLYVVESRATPHRLIWSYAVDLAHGRLSDKRLAVDAQGPGALDGICVDTEGRLWCGWGSNGAQGADPAELDGVRIFSPTGQLLGAIDLPERCANLCFGGPKGNRLFMASSRSLYALYVNARGVVR